VKIFIQVWNLTVMCHSQESLVLRYGLKRGLTQCVAENIYRRFERIGFLHVQYRSVIDGRIAVSYNVGTSAKVHGVTSRVIINVSTHVWGAFRTESFNKSHVSSPDSSCYINPLKARINMNYSPRIASYRVVNT
jgi:hypothetical protein